MAAPTPVSVTKTLVSALTANPAANLDPATQIGDRTVITLCFGRSRPIGCAWPSPWTELYDVNNTVGNQMEQSAGWLDHSSAAPASVAVAAGPAGTTTVAMLAFAYRFAGGDYDPATPPEFVTAINTGDPPNFDPSWTGEEWRAIAGLSRDGAWGTPTYPLPTGQQFDNIFGSFGTCHGVIATDATDLAQWISTGVGTVSVVGVRGAVVAASDLVLAAVLPALVSDITAEAHTPAQIAAVLPALTSDLAADASTDVAVAATLPALTSGFTAQAGTSASLSATLPGLTAGLAADSTASGTLAVTLPALTADLTGTVDTPGAQLAAVLPALTAALVGEAFAAAVLAGSLPALTASLTAIAGDIEPGAARFVSRSTPLVDGSTTTKQHVQIGR